MTRSPIAVAVYAALAALVLGIGSSCVHGRVAPDAHATVDVAILKLTGFG